MDKIKLGVLVGGTSIEREVSKKSCENLLANLDENKYDITVYHLPADGNTEWAKTLFLIHHKLYLVPYMVETEKTVLYRASSIV